jgi:hypothetical protein
VFDSERGIIELIYIYSRITGKEEMVDLYQEEAEVFKEKNYHHKERVNLLYFLNVLHIVEQVAIRLE